MAFIYTYLTLGFIYAMYVWLFAGDPWWAIPFNTIGGPVVVVMEFIRAWRTKKILIQEMFSTKKAVIFDLDGTIVDSQPFKDQAVENMLEKIEAAWVYREYPHGLNEIEKWEHILHANKGIETKFTIKELAEHTKAEYLNLFQEVEPFPGFWQFVHFLKNEKQMKIGLATNSDRDVTMTVLQRMGAQEIFDFIIAGDEVKHRKPNPEIYHTAVKKMGFKPKEVVVFEDSLVGANSAHRAGLDVIVVWDGKDAEKEDYPKGSYGFIPDYDDLDVLLSKSYAEHVKDGVEILKEYGVAE